MPTKLSKLIFWSSVGRKIVLALSGLAIFMFLLVHLAGNLTLFLNRPALFNGYAQKLQDMGILLYFAEIMLVLLFLTHITYAIAVTLENWKGRSTNYYKVTNAGAPSRKGISSTTMIYTGLLILVFIVIHIKTLKYGPEYKYEIKHSAGYTEEVRDLHRLVKETFKNEWYLAGYLAAMLLIGFHLWHAFGSAFQSLGFEHTEYMPYIFGFGMLMAFLIAAGFLAIPVYIYLFYPN